MAVFRLWFIHRCLLISYGFAKNRWYRASIETISLFSHLSFVVGVLVSMKLISFKDFASIPHPHRTPTSHLHWAVWETVDFPNFGNWEFNKSLALASPLCADWLRDQATVQQDSSEELFRRGHLRTELNFWIFAGASINLTWLTRRLF